MSVSIMTGDVRDRLKELPDDHFDCVVTSPPYWGLRSYLPADHPEKAHEIGLEPTLGEHLDVLLGVFREVRRVMKPEATLWLNYGDCYATKPNGRSAADTKAAGRGDRTFRDKPFSTVGKIYPPESGQPFPGVPRRGGGNNFDPSLKPKDLCMIPNRLAIAMQEDGWWVRSEIIWGKPNPMPDSSGKYRPSTAHEKIWLFTKSAKSFYDAVAVRMPAEESSIARWQQDVDGQEGSHRANGGRKTNGTMKAVGGPHTDKQRGHKAEQQANGRLLRNYEPSPWSHDNFVGEVWHIPPAAYSEAHFATFPPALVEPCIAAGSPIGGHVLDPFGGAGTVGLVADRMGRKATLIDLNPAYVDIAHRRISNDAGMFARVAAE